MMQGSSLLNPGGIIAAARCSQPDRFGGGMSANYQELVSSFLAILRGRQIPFVVVGGIALLQHVQGRNTDDMMKILHEARQRSRRIWKG